MAVWTCNSFRFSFRSPSCGRYASSLFNRSLAGYLWSLKLYKKRIHVRMEQTVDRLFIRVRILIWGATEQPS